MFWRYVGISMKFGISDPDWVVFNGLVFSIRGGGLMQKRWRAEQGISGRKGKVLWGVTGGYCVCT